MIPRNTDDIRKTRGRFYKVNHEITYVVTKYGNYWWHHDYSCQKLQTAQMSLDDVKHSTQRKGFLEVYEDVVGNQIKEIPVLDLRLGW